MNRFESLLGVTSAGLAGAVGLYAVFVVGVLVVQGPAKGPAPTAPEVVATTTDQPPAEVTAEVTADAAQPDQASVATAETPVETPVSDADADEAPSPAGVDLAAGEAEFRACRACHTADDSRTNRTGPSLWGVVGRHRGSITDFNYSDTLSAQQNEIWDSAALDAFLTDPRGYAPGTLMTFRGLRDADARANLIAWLATRSDNPVMPAGQSPAADANTADAAIEILPVPYPEGVVYTNPPAQTEADRAAIDERVAQLEALITDLDYQSARYNSLHFQPDIASASNEECLVCHSEILDHEPREASLAGLRADETLAWYQTLDTYEGPQASFHWRHLQSPFAQQVMNLDCNFCHRGNDPREESPDMMPGRAAFSTPDTPEFTLRKMVNPSETCLRCHGAYPAENMGLEGTWDELRADMEFPDAPNGCLTCHAESYRTERHAVTYLNAATIEELAREGSSDTCYGCHGGRAWYRISYPYPRHPWPLMDPETPEWAVGRPVQSDPAFQLPAGE